MCSGRGGGEERGVERRGEGGRGEGGGGAPMKCTPGFANPVAYAGNRHRVGSGLRVCIGCAWVCKGVHRVYTRMLVCFCSHACPWPGSVPTRRRRRRKRRGRTHKEEEKEEEKGGGRTHKEPCMWDKASVPEGVPEGAEAAARPAAAAAAGDAAAAAASSASSSGVFLPHRF